MRMMLSLLLVFLITNLILSHSWHAYEFKSSTPTDECSTFGGGYINAEMGERYGLWSNLIAPPDLREPEFLFGFKYALDTIWKHQNPVDCSKSKFLVSTGHHGGFGSVIHVEGQLLGAALDTNRIFVLHPNGPQQISRDFAYVTENPLCKRLGKSTLECYYIPVSSCDIMVEMHKSGVSFSEVREFSKKNSGDRFLMASRSASVKINNYFPNIFSKLLDCSPMKADFKYYWWRAVSAAYLLRPNDQTKAILAKLPVPRVEAGAFKVGMYVRHGDKHIEMELVPFSIYANVTDALFHSGGMLPVIKASSVPPSDANSPIGAPMGGLNSASRVEASHAMLLPGSKYLFLGTEDPNVITEAQAWAATTGWKIGFTNYFDRAQLSTWLDYQHQTQQRESKSTVHDPLEYISMLKNLELLVLSDAWVCTLASNYCRVVDELRVALAGKGNRVFVDLSKESCRAPPCFTDDGRDIYDLGW